MEEEETEDEEESESLLNQSVSLLDIEDLDEFAKEFAWNQDQEAGKQGQNVDVDNTYEKEGRSEEYLAGNIAN